MYDSASNVSPEACESAVAATLKKQHPRVGRIHFGSDSRRMQPGENGRVELLGVGIKDLILPGEMKSLLNQVVEAEKQAQANLIRRREETAATRSLLNTAKLMEENPTLLRLKELEMLEKVTDPRRRCSTRCS